MLHAGVHQPAPPGGRKSFRSSIFPSLNQPPEIDTSPLRLFCSPTAWGAFKHSFKITFCFERFKYNSIYWVIIKKIRVWTKWWLFFLFSRQEVKFYSTRKCRATLLLTEHIVSWLPLHFMSSILGLFSFYFTETSLSRISWHTMEPLKRGNTNPAFEWVKLGYLWIQWNHSGFLFSVSPFSILHSLDPSKFQVQSIKITSSKYNSTTKPSPWQHQSSFHQPTHSNAGLMFPL